MIQALLHNKLKDSFSPPTFKPSEDSLTSSVIGLLQYLPDTLFWKILSGSCGNHSGLPQTINNIKLVDFWEKLKPDGKINVKCVEPDVLIETDNYDIIIEAKKDDLNRQDQKQWWKELSSFFETYQCECERVIFIALGGNRTLENSKIEVKNTIHTIYTGSWYNLLIVVNDTLRSIMSEEADDVKNGQIRILHDLVAIMAKHGFVTVNWLESFVSKPIKNDAVKTITDLWEIDDKKRLENLIKDVKPININPNFDIWRQK